MRDPARERPDALHPLRAKELRLEFSALGDVGVGAHPLPHRTIRLEDRNRSDADLVRDLQSDDARVRGQAVRALADRRNPAAVEGLVEQLSDEDPPAADRAIGALAEIGDQRAVMPLIELGHRRGGRDLAQIARIVGDLGGREARSWLDTLAIGHEDAEVRAAAREALAELVSREDGKMAGSAR